MSNLARGSGGPGMLPQPSVPRTPGLPSAGRSCFPERPLTVGQVQAGLWEGGEETEPVCPSGRLWAGVRARSAAACGLAVPTRTLRATAF